MRTLTILAGLALCTLAPAARGQGSESLATLRAGDTIKVWAVAPRLNGDLGAFSGFRDDTLTLGDVPLMPTAAVRARVPYANLRRIDVRRGTHRSTTRTVAGVLLGAAGGLVVGVMIGPTIQCGSRCGDNGDLEGLAGALVGGTVGLVAGGITGGVIGAKRRPRWEPVALRR